MSCFNRRGSLWQSIRGTPLHARSSEKTLPAFKVSPQICRCSWHQVYCSDDARSAIYGVAIRHADRSKAGCIAISGKVRLTSRTNAPTLSPFKALSGPREMLGRQGLDVDT